MDTQKNSQELYDLLYSNGFKHLNDDGKLVAGPKTTDISGDKTTPDEAETLEFQFIKDGVDYGPITIAIENDRKMTVYYNDKIANSEKEESHNNDISWYSIIRMLKQFRQTRGMSMELKKSDHKAHDFAKRNKLKKLEEGYYPMGKKSSYSDAIPSVKIVIEHSRVIEEGEQRYRNVNRIFLENMSGERFLLDTKKPGIARVYARHIAEGGKPNDERWNHIQSLVEEYSKMAGFVRAVRGSQFNESAHKLVEAGLNHYGSLRETLTRMTGRRGYNIYFESWTPTLMEDETDEDTLNELFVQETLDPRIESVMPILNRLSKNISEMKEVKELEEWADNLSEAPGAETLAHNQQTEKQRLKAFDLEETEDAEAAHKKINTPAVFRKGDKVTLQDLEKAKERNISGKEGLAALTKRLQDIGQLEEEEVEESALQAWLGREKYGEKGMEELQRLGREHASKEKVAKAKAKFAKENVEGVAEGLASDYRKTNKPSAFAHQVYDKLGLGQKNPRAKGDIADPTNIHPADTPTAHAKRLNRANVHGFGDKHTAASVKGAGPTIQGKEDPLDSLGRRTANQIKTSLGKHSNVGAKLPKGVAEDLDADQKRVGQLGPTEKVKNNNIGKLVGANESLELNEMDKSQPSSDRGGESSGNPYAKGGKATPIKAKDAEKDAEKALNKSMDKAHKKDVKEGQEDLDAILRIIRK